MLNEVSYNSDWTGLVWEANKFIVLQEFALVDITRLIVSPCEEIGKLNDRWMEQSIYLSLDCLLVFIEFMENVFS